MACKVFMHTCVVGLLFCDSAARLINDRFIICEICIPKFNVYPVWNLISM